MKRTEFTKLITQLLSEMIAAGSNPIIDYVKRSPEEQKKLFDSGESKCDGISKLSQHQLGKAMDVYFVKSDDTVDYDNQKLYDKWHTRWEAIGGNKRISWDNPHFEVF